MRADVGNKIVVRGRKVGDRSREGVIVAVQGADGGPPYLVEWSDQPDEQHLYFPGSDALIA